MAVIQCEMCTWIWAILRAIPYSSHGHGYGRLWCILVLSYIRVSLISKSPRIAANRHKSPRIATNRHESPRIATNRSRPNSGVNNQLRSSVAVWITSFKWCSGIVTSVVRKAAPHVRQQFFIDKTFNFINFMWRTATKSFVRRTLFIPPCPTVCGQSWKCVAIRSRRYARGAIWRKTVYKLLKWRHWRV